MRIAKPRPQRRRPPSGLLPRLLDTLFQRIPAGVGGSSGPGLSRGELRRVLERGARWAVERGFGSSTDLEFVEDGGCLPGADPEAVSDRALERGRAQLGTLGSGNHFLELQRVEQLYDLDAAAVLGLEVGTVAISIHTGSRGLGYQVCQDHLQRMVAAAPCWSRIPPAAHPLHPCL